MLQCIEPRILTAPSRRDALGKLLAEQLRVDTRRRAHRVRRILGRARSARTVRRGNACAEVRGSCSASKLGVIVALLHTSRRPHREQSTERVSRPSAYLVGRPAISFARPTWRGAAGMESCGLGKKCDLRKPPIKKMRHEFCGSELRKRATAAVSFLGHASGVHVGAHARSAYRAARHRPAAPRRRASGARRARAKHGRGRYAGLGRVLRLPKQHSAASGHCFATSPSCASAYSSHQPRLRPPALAPPAPAA